jgi:hypothetical protein
MEEADDIRLVKAIEARMETGQEPIYSHDEIWGEIDTLESKGALPD